MEHTCTGTESQNREIVKSNEGWMMIHEHDEYENVDVSTDGIKYCPFCGEELEYMEWKMRQNES